MRTAEIKRRYLAHFEANGHTVVPSAPLPAIDDPNLLFINAGMVQLVPYFLGQRTAPFAVGPGPFWATSSSFGRRRTLTPRCSNPNRPRERRLTTTACVCRWAGPRVGAGPAAYVLMLVLVRR